MTSNRKFSRLSQVQREILRIIYLFADAPTDPCMATDSIRDRARQARGARYMPAATVMVDGYERRLRGRWTYARGFDNRSFKRSLRGLNKKGLIKGELHSPPNLRPYVIWFLTASGRATIEAELMEKRALADNAAPIDKSGHYGGHATDNSNASPRTANTIALAIENGGAS